MGTDVTVEIKCGVSASAKTGADIETDFQIAQRWHTAFIKSILDKNERLRNIDNEEEAYYLRAVRRSTNILVNALETAYPELKDSYDYFA